MGNIRVWAKGTREYENLEKLAKRLEELSTHGTKYTVEDVYFDFGQDWKWTTIVAHRPSDDGLRFSTWQVLNPREHSGCVFSYGNEVEIEEIAMSVWNDKYNCDR